MSRVKGGVVTRRKHKKFIDANKGFKGYRGKLYGAARDAFIKAGQNSYVGRKLRKRQMRRLWITRINAACKMHDVNYSRFTHGLLKAKVAVDRKQLSELAIHNPDIFKQIVEVAKAELV